ncbi:2-hydroxyacid dehydrogenase [Sedimentitalea sp. XS_ASV28]|uniref:2-hydroxyacid dehydrogenase n=1 Tax=Sedimentitalea sp. XS_ASV28 TaxID=3241296 RepID=UPI0035110293
MTGKPDLLVIGGVTERMMDRLTAEFTIHALYDQPDEAAFLAAHGAAITAVLTNGHDGLRPGLMAALPNLKIVSSYGVGYDAIDATAAADRGIVVTHTPNVLNDEVANTALLLWFAVSRRLVPHDAYVRAGRWQAEGNAPLTRSVQGRTVGIVGLGRIGQAIADRLAAFDSTVIYHSRNAKDVPYRYYADLSEMAADSDVLICITPGGAGTKHLIDKDVIDALGPEGILVNVSRGSVVDEAALVQALQDGRLGGAGLDVFEEEPRVPAELFGMDNVVLQPHVGSATHETRQAMGDLTCDNLSQWFRDGTTITPVPECRNIG